jgi:hypothetical protein
MSTELFIVIGIVFIVVNIINMVITYIVFNILK